MVDPRLHQQFVDDGVIAVRQAFSSDAAAAMRDAIWRRIEDHTTARRTEPETWRNVRLPTFKPIKQRPAFRAVAESTALCSWLDAIFGPGAWQPSGSGVQVLFTFPNSDEWALPHHLWHFDTGFEPVYPTTMVKVFCCLDTVGVGGGGTLAIAGSHRMVDRYQAALPADQRAGNQNAWRRCLNTDPWTRSLIRPGDEPDRTNQMMNAHHDADGIELRIVEMTGEPGDVFITDIHTFHCTAPNARERPRMMLGVHFTRAVTTPTTPLDSQHRTVR